jgi:hypothetical protein
MAGQVSPTTHNVIVVDSRMLNPNLASQIQYCPAYPRSNHRPAGNRTAPRKLRIRPRLGRRHSQTLPDSPRTLKQPKGLQADLLSYFAIYDSMSRMLLRDDELDECMAIRSGRRNGKASARKRSVKRPPQSVSSTIACSSTSTSSRHRSPCCLAKSPPVELDGSSYIEQFFDPALLTTTIDGKTFNPNKEHEAAGE